MLRDPIANSVFYVGKGTAGSLSHHFRSAVSVSACEDDPDRLREVRKLLGRGLSHEDIGRVVARVDEEPHAFALEALYLKFVFGLTALANVQPGHHSGTFRARGDWEIRRGFDLPFIVDPGIRTDRAEKLDGMLGEGLDIPLVAVQVAFPQLVFDPPKVLDSSELGIEADVFDFDGNRGTRIKVFIRREKLQVELRHRTKSQRDWMKAHFCRLEAYPLRRRDDVFFPDQWRGGANMTADPDEAVRRVKLMLDIATARSRADLSPEAAALLPRPLPAPPPQC